MKSKIEETTLKRFFFKEAKPIEYSSEVRDLDISIECRCGGTQIRKKMESFLVLPNINRS